MKNVRQLDSSQNMCRSSIVLVLSTKILVPLAKLRFNFKLQYTRVIQKIRGQCRSPSNYLSEIQNQYIIFCKNIYSVNVWNFNAIGQMDLILINFKTSMFCTHRAMVTSGQKHNTNAIYFTNSQVFKIAPFYFTQNVMHLTHSLKTMSIHLNY
jgi:hypothetical protein